MANKPPAPKWLIENIAEASKNARKIFFLYLSFLTYCALTVVSTSDRQIILNETASLPILKLDVSLNGFFILGPLIAILIFVFFQLYLQRIKGLIHDPKYASINKKKLYPWMVIIAEDPEPGFVGTLQRIFVDFSLWIALTLVLLLFAFFYIRKHEPFWSYVVGLYPILGFLITYYFWMKKEKITAGEKTSILIGFCLVIIFELCLFIYVIPLAREGRGADWLQRFMRVDLSYEELAKKPEIDYPGLYWVDLSRTHLQGARLVNAVLKRANLSYAELERASMQEAVLQGADLTGANLKEAKLSEANLQGANLWAANLQGTILWGANLQEANLSLVFELTVEQLSEVKTLYKAKLRPITEEQIKRNYPYLLEKPKLDQ